MTDTLQELQSIIVERFGVSREELDPERSLDSFGLDSLGVIELMFNIEDHYGIDMPDRGPEIKTLNELALWVDSLRDAQRGTPPDQ
ncbi:MAG: acyl carrier protein [Betaproteobacteria bacterium]|nr:acyl carrier protein [Betaproteobacteria bacterium]